MGVYFRGGAVYGYKVDVNAMPVLEDVDPYIGEQAWAIARRYGVKDAYEGDQMNGTIEEVVFYDEGNYFAGSMNGGNDEYGFFKVGGEEPSKELQELARDIEGEWGTYGFFTVY